MNLGISYEILNIVVVFLLLGDAKHELHKQLCETVEPTIVGGILRSVKYEDSEAFYRRYLHDFVRLVHRCTHSSKDNEIKEYEVISFTPISCFFFDPLFM